MNSKRIVKIIEAALLESLRKFPEAVRDSIKHCDTEKTNDERRDYYNMNRWDATEHKIDPLKFGGCDNIGFDVSLSNPRFNRMIEEDGIDSPCVDMIFSNLSNGSIDPKNLAKIILFGLSTDFVYKIPKEDYGCRSTFIYNYVIDKLEFDGGFYKIKIFFKCIGVDKEIY